METSTEYLKLKCDYLSSMIRVSGFIHFLSIKYISNSDRFELKIKMVILGYLFSRGD
jgi:hypothetical protein